MARLVILSTLPPIPKIHIPSTDCDQGKPTGNSNPLFATDLTAADHKAENFASYEWAGEGLRKERHDETCGLVGPPRTSPEEWYTTHPKEKNNKQRKKAIKVNFHTPKKGYTS